MIARILSLSLLLAAFAPAAHAADPTNGACAFFAGDRARFCVQNNFFGRYELIELAKGGIPLTISLKDTTLDKFDLKAIAEAGPLTVLGNSSRLGKYDLLEIAKAGATVWVLATTSQANFTKYDFLELAGGGVKIALTVDDGKFGMYDLAHIAAGKTLQVSYRSSLKVFSKYDLKQIVAAGAELFLVVDDASFNKYDLLELARSGLRVN